MKQKPQDKINAILKKNKTREFISQFIYYPHGHVVKRLNKSKPKACEGCEADIDAIIDEIRYTIIELLEGKCKRIDYQCKKCKVKCFYAPGIGEYCPKCGNDYGLEKIEK
jgi:hypothetical protein